MPFIEGTGAGADDDDGEVEGVPGGLFLFEKVESSGEEAGAAEEVAEVEDFIEKGDARSRGGVEGAAGEKPEGDEPDGEEDEPEGTPLANCGKLHGVCSILVRSF